VTGAAVAFETTPALCEKVAATVVFAVSVMVQAPPPHVVFVSALKYQPNESVSVSVMTVL
jgi:hypothetical protein